MTTTIVVGLDGAGFRLLQPWLATGELPTLERIVEEGISGDLRSVAPPVTSPNWKAYATGKNPGKLGIYWWYNVDTDARRVYRPADRYHDHAEYWDYLTDRERVGVVGVPTTHPPKPTGEAYVSGAPDASETGYAMPETVERELRERFDYRPSTRHSMRSETEAAYEETLDRIDTQFKAGKYLLETRDLSFLQLTTFHINVLHHHFWDDERTLRAWRMIDDHLASLLDDDVNLVLMSDHGHAEIQTVFYVNRWLERKGFLSFDTHVSGALHRAGFTADRLNYLLAELDSYLPFDPQVAAERLTPQRLVNHLPNDDGEVGRGKLDEANWPETTAIGSAQGPIYVTVDGPRYETQREELIDRLERLTTPDGRPVARAVHRGESVYDGGYADEWPDLVLEKMPSVHVSDTLGGNAIFSREHDAWRGVNTRSGLFAAVGPAFTSGTIDDLSILDLAPTLLHLHGRPIPAGMDGRVRTSVFSAGSAHRTRPVIRSERTPN
jgi:predicted AlkP superfamily phosphohydrolase/phosphomutase